MNGYQGSMMHPFAYIQKHMMIVPNNKLINGDARHDAIMHQVFFANEEGVDRQKNKTKGVLDQTFQH